MKLNKFTMGALLVLFGSLISSVTWAQSQQSPQASNLASRVWFGPNHVNPTAPSADPAPAAPNTSQGYSGTYGSSAAYAQNPAYFIKGNRPCWDAAAAFHHVDPWLLYAIAYVESHFHTGAVGKNTNGSVDMGMMQINSIWHKTLIKQGIPLSALNNACASTYIGAWILSKNIKTYGYTWRAIGAYNSGNPKKGLAYAKKVYAAHRILVATHNPHALDLPTLASQ